MSTSAPRDISTDVLALREAHVFVLGDALLDVYVDGRVDRISPEAPVPVVHEQSRHEVLGGAANVAANIVALGARATLAARIGQDADGERFRALAADRGIGADGLVTDAGVPTVRKTRVRAGYQQLMRLDREDPVAAGAEATAALLGHLDAFLAGDEGAPRAVVLADYAKGVLTDALLRAVIDRCRAADVPVVVDPKGPLARYAGATILKPNRAEAVAAGAAVDAAPEALADAVLTASGTENVVLSLSADGVIAAGAALAAPLHLRSHVVQVADVSGAGDTMVSLLATAIAVGLPLDRAVQLANLAAGRVCQKLGTATLTASELLEAFNRETERSTPEKWLGDRDTASRITAAHRADGRRVVFTNGCFDVLHAGHVRLLQTARAKGDLLVVAVNTDDSIRRLKGPSRPVTGLEDRVAVLTALACVDFVCAFDEDTPLELILATQPDVIVKGGDYTPEDVVGGAEAADWGGRVEIVPLLAGHSTTAILEAGARGA